MSYEDNLRWRRKYPEKWLAQKYLNYERGRRHDVHSREPWTDSEDAAVLAHESTDREIADALGRSVQAVQIRRTRLLARKRATAIESETCK